MATVAKDKINMAGDVNIDDVTIITSQGFAQTITDQIMAIEIYEDMFAPFITGKVVLRDAQELTNLLPLIGEETIRIRIITPTLPEKDAYEGEFYIYKMDDRIKTQERELVYVLHFVSKEAIVDLNKKISKGYQGKVSDIVQRLLTDQDAMETKKDITIEETINTTRYTSNFWSPVKNIQYMCDTAISKAYESPSYLFFENKYGLNFVSLETLYADGPLLHYFQWDNYSAPINSTGGSRRSIEEDYRRITDIQMDAGFNYIDRLKSGMYGSEIIYFDIMTKQYVHKGFGFNFNDTKHLNKYPLYSDKIGFRPKAVLIHENQYYNNFEGYDVVSNTKIVQERMALLAQAEGHKVTITVFGKTDYSAGQKVYLEAPKNTQLAKDDPNYLDVLLSGHYLIGALCHFITREKHECTMELIKDSILVNLNDTN